MSDYTSFLRAKSQAVKNVEHAAMGNAFGVETDDLFDSMGAEAA